MDKSNRVLQQAADCEAFRSRRAEPTRRNAEEGGNDLRRKEDHIRSKRRENRLKGFGLVPVA